MIGTLLGFSIISFLFMATLMWLSIKQPKYDHWVLPAVLCSSAICAISLFSVGVLLL